MNSREPATDHEPSGTQAVSGGPPRRSRAGARHGHLHDLVLVVVTLLIGETLVWVGQPLYGAAWYGFMYVVFVNVIIRVRPSEAGPWVGSRRFEWRVLVLLSVTVADRLWVLSMPPFQSGDLDIPGLWALPLLIGGLLLARSSLVVDAWPPAPHGKHRPKPGGRQSLSLSPAAMAVVVAVASVALGTVAAVLAQAGGWRTEIRTPAVIAVIVGAFAVQEWLYRRVVQPVAMRMWGVASGGMLASGLAGFAWLAALASVGSFNAATLVAVAVASMMFGYVAATGPRGVWLAALGCATLMAALLLYPSGADYWNLVGFLN